MFRFIFIILSTLFVFLSTYGAKNNLIPDSKVTGVWAYGENVTDSLELNYKQNNLRFFFGTDKSLPSDSISYRVMLRGYDTKWMTPFKEGWYFYTDLPPGDYEFVAQSRFGNGTWGKEAVHGFSIVAPWWRSWVAYVLYFCILSGTLIIIGYLIKTKLKIYNQLTVEREKHRFKTDFVIHACREIKTPLTVIRSTVEKLKDRQDLHISRTDMQHLRNSCESLMQMVESLAEYRDLKTDISEFEKNDILEMADVPINRNTTVMIVESDKQLADVMRRNILRFLNAIVVDCSKIIDMAQSDQPAAIILDTELKDLNAYDILHSLKSKSDTCNIPVILISDFNNRRSLLRAIKSEADDYLQKPFNCEVLTALVMKRIKLSRQQIDINEGTKDCNIYPIFEKTSEKLFLQRLDNLIDSNIHDTDFNVMSIAGSLGISRAQLYNKIKGISGLTPVEYLRDMRLSKAASLLRESNISVKEVRFMVGMPDPSNFNRRFKEKFDIRPSDIRQL